MLDALLANKPKIKITTFYNLPKQKAILDFLLNKFQNSSFLIWKFDSLSLVLSLFKNDYLTYHQRNHKFHFNKKYIVEFNSLKDDKKFIKWRNEIKLGNKFIHPYSITTIKQKIEYLILKVIFNAIRDRQYRGKFNLLSYKVLELNIISFEKISLKSFKEGDLKLFNKFVFKDILL